MCISDFSVDDIKEPLLDQMSYGTADSTTNCNSVDRTDWRDLCGCSREKKLISYVEHFTGQHFLMHGKAKVVCHGNDHISRNTR